jgi:hypothetical protein
MEVIHIATGHAFEIIGALAIIASLLFTALELRHVQKAQAVTNLLTITKHHREIWSLVFDRPSLSRVLDPMVSVKSSPVTNDEALFVTFLILHLKSSYKAAGEGLFVTPEALTEDIRWFFSLPIPEAVWTQSKISQDDDFVSFVETALTEPPRAGQMEGMRSAA